MNKNLVLHLSDKDFQIKAIEAIKPILIDFWAVWCAPCKIISSILEEIANQYAMKLIIGKLNIENNPITTAKYNIRSIPTLLFLKKGKKIDEYIGLLSKDQLQNFIDKNI
ncbi:MAG: thioredoxin [Arsenophonus sp.]|nr:MAG: thioredoxin [Arsenophonus sp.]